MSKPTPRRSKPAVPAPSVSPDDAEAARDSGIHKGGTRLPAGIPADEYIPSEQDSRLALHAIREGRFAELIALVARRGAMDPAQAIPARQTVPEGALGDAHRRIFMTTGSVDVAMPAAGGVRPADPPALRGYARAPGIVGWASVLLVATAVGYQIVGLLRHAGHDRPSAVSLWRPS